MKLSIIIPVYHEKEAIFPCLERLLGTHHELEIIVVDGAPEGDTVHAVHAWIESAQQTRMDVEKQYYSNNLATLKLEKSKSGRGSQMNYGAACATGEVLLFLHVDTVLPCNYFELLEKVYGAGHWAGAFSLCIDDSRPWFRVIEYLANKRNTWTKTPYGDQAQFFTAKLFKSIGGYAEIPLMEDVDIMRRLRTLGGLGRVRKPLYILKECATTSARRWHDEGIVYCSLRNVILRTLYAFGVSPTSLAKWYGFEKRCRLQRSNDVHKRHC
ncbi:MAG: TIGR04283 family arsenosugar biosynthesis glycosyltransferase [Pseudomonadota bacterium]